MTELHTSKAPVTADWILQRYMMSPWDNSFYERLGFVLKRDETGKLLPEPKRFQNESMGIAVTAPGREGKTFLVQQVLERLFGEAIDVENNSRQIAYCRLRTDATIKSAYMDICRSTGFEVKNPKLTRAAANDLAMHRLKLAGVKIVVLDEVHNLLRSKSEPVNLFLKTLLQDGGGVCLIVIGTEKLRDFIYDMPENEELAGRLLDFRLDPFSRKQAIDLIALAVSKYAENAKLKLARSLTRDIYFHDRIYDGCRGSYGRCMRLIATSVIQALEQGASSLELADFEAVFDLQFLHFNSENPFRTDYQPSSVTSSSVSDLTQLSGDIDDGSSPPKTPGRKRRVKK